MVSLTMLASSCESKSLVSYTCEFQQGSECGNLAVAAKSAHGSGLHGVRQSPKKLLLSSKNVFVVPGGGVLAS